MLETIGFLELNSIAKGVEAADLILKTAEVDLIFAKAGCPGKYYILFTGEVAAVKASLDAGAAIGGNHTVDSCVIPRVHPQVIKAINLAAEPGTPQAPEGGDISSFQYELNGHTYQFPTPMSEIAPEDIQLDRQIRLPYDISSDADMESGSWTEIINTQYFYFENSLYKEMTGITNMTGYDTVLSEGILTALIDTNGTYLNVVLPGNVHVGSSEADILKGFPAFAGKQLDGVATFVGNDYLYACNVRDDGCNGYAIVRNDDPFYSAVTIICENSVIKEISFECIGAERAKGVFQ